MSRTQIMVAIKTPPPAPPKQKPRHDLKSCVCQAMDIIDSQMATTRERRAAWKFLKRVYARIQNSDDRCHRGLAERIYSYIEKFGLKDPQGSPIQPPRRK